MSVSYNTSFVRNGLLLYFDAANIKSYPGSGNTWYDISNTGNNGTLNDVSFNNNAMDFGGSSSSISLYNFVLDRPFTIGFWCNVYPTASSDCFYCSRTVLGNGISIFGTGENKTLRFDTGTNQWSPGYEFPINTPVNIEVSIDVDSIKVLRVNGNFESSTGFAGSIINASETYASIGASNVNGGSFNNYFRGSIYNYYIYNRAITEDETRKNFTALRGRFGV